MKILTLFCKIVWLHFLFFPLDFHHSRFLRTKTLFSNNNYYERKTPPSTLTSSLPFSFSRKMNFNYVYLQYSNLILFLRFCTADGSEKIQIIWTCSLDKLIKFWRISLFLWWKMNFCLFFVVLFNPCACEFVTVLNKIAFSCIFFDNLLTFLLNYW